MSDTSGKSKRFVYFWEDHQFRNLRESTVGRKGLSLFELKDMDIPIPEFFVISSTLFDNVISQSLERDVEKMLEKNRNPEEDEVLKSILKTDVGKEAEEEIRSAYTRISGFTDAWVSVRSSVVFPSVPDVSFSGVFATELNVRGVNNLLESVKKIYASCFTDDVVAYAAAKGINLADVKLSVVVQKMVQAEVSGVVFTVDPITQDPTKLSIEAVFGLGDTIALGELTPDTYLLNKRDISLIEKHVSPQEWMKVRTMGRGSKGGVEKIKISSNWSHMQKLEEKYLKEISKIALIVESKARRAQSLEWVLAGGKVWVLQSKDLYEKHTENTVSVVNSKEFDTLGEVLRLSAEKYAGIGLIESKAVDHAKRIVNSNRHEYDGMTEKLVNVAKVKSTTPAPQSTPMLNRDNFVLSGIGASFGTVTGRAIVLEKDKAIEVTKNDILVIREYASEMESLIVKAGGVIMDVGGVTSDTAILCREFNIPAVVGVGTASSAIHNGDIVRVDGNAGSIYKESNLKVKEEFKENIQSKVHPVVEAYKEENLSGIDLLKGEEEEKVEVVDRAESKEDSVLKIPHDISLPPSATKVFTYSNLEYEKLIDYVGNSHGIVYIDLDKVMLEDGRHMLAYVEDKKFVEYAKDISEKVCRYIDLAEGNQVVLSIGSQKVKEFRGLVKGKLENQELEDSVYGLTRYLKNKEYLNRVLKIVRRIRNVHKKRNVDIAVHSPMNGTFMKDFKKSLSANGLRRTNTFRVYAILDNPTEIIMADDILEAKIDGVILNMPRVVRVMQGFDMDNESARYDLGVNSAFKIVDTVVDISRPYDKHVIVISENNKALIKYSVQKGVYGVSVFAEDIKESRRLVSEEEAKVILGTK